jgi:hypothetical protein
MRPTSLFIIAGLIIGAVILDQPARADGLAGDVTMIQSRHGVAVPLFVGAGLLGSAIGAAIALVVTGNDASATASAPAHRPDRPSPDREFPDFETVAGLFGEPAGDPVDGT